MLSISKVASGGDYYQYLTQNYYFDQAQHTQWMGQGAEALGLRGQVEAEQFSKLAAGFGLDGRPLVQNAGDDRRTSAWDLTYSAPKDVSALWAIGPEEVKRVIEGCHREAVSEAVSYLEDEAGYSRKAEQGEKEVSPVRAKLVVATFDDGVSRERDPQIHTHAIAFNVSVCEDGETRAVHSPKIFGHKMAAGAVYQTTLARLLVERLGLELSSERQGFSITGVPEELAKEWSKRREQIEQALGARNAHTAKAASIAALDTRKGKEGPPERGIFERWQREAARHGFGVEQVRALLGRAKPTPEHERRQLIDQVVSHAAERLLKSESHLSARELVRAAADRLRDGTASGHEIRRAVSEWLKRPEVVAVGERKNEARYTTREVIELERRFLETAKAMAAQESHAVSERFRRKVVAKTFPEHGVSDDDRKRNEGQRRAVRHITQAQGVSVLSGMAGTGKSTVLDAARRIWERDGYRVVGIALAGIAAKNLKESSGIESETLALRLKQLEGRGVAGSVWHHVKQLAKTAANELHRDINLPIYRSRPFTLDRKSVVVLDEAGMVETKDLARLLDHVRAAGAKLVLVGDSNQLQPIGAGGPLRRLEAELGAARLSHITRQRLDQDDRSPHWRREAVTLFEAGKAKEGLSLYAERGFVAVEADRKRAAQKLVSDWTAKGGLTDPKNHLIIAGTNADVRHLNALCQEERLKATGFETRLKGIEHRGERLHEGDRVLFTKLDRTLGLKNGELGTIQGISGLCSKRLSVLIDDGRTVSVPLDQYGDVRLGYAVTTHKAQGSTVDHSYMLAGGPMQDLHLSYVQASRARLDTRFYVDQFEAGPNLERLSKAMSQARPKEMAHDLFDPIKARHHHHEMEMGR